MNGGYHDNDMICNISGKCRLFDSLCLYDLGKDAPMLHFSQGLGDILVFLSLKSLILEAT